MPLIDPTDILNNLLVLGILLWIGFMIYTKMDKDKVHSAMEKIKGWVGSKEE